jgi:tyrosine-protein kinase Etk/Wzc
VNILETSGSGWGAGAGITHSNPRLLPGNVDDAGLDLREFLRVVLKHWTLMLGVLCAVLLVAGLYVLTATPVWQATVTVKLPEADKGSDPLKELMALNGSSDPVETYMEVARSFNVAMRAARAVSLTSAEQFSEYKDITEAAEVLLKKELVTVTNVKMSNILVFHVQVQDPQLAVNLANAWAQAFIDTNLDFQRIGATSRRNFIDAQLAEVKVDLTNGEEALRRLSQRQGTLHSSVGVATGSSGETNPLAALQTKVEDLQIERSDLASRYGPEYPRVKEVEAEYKEARDSLDRQMNKLPVNEMEYTRQAREVKADETIYNLLLEKGQEARISENVDDSGIVVVDVARAPHLPVAPQKARIMLLSLLAGILLSLGAAWSLERWLDEVGGETEMAELSGLPVLAMVPDWKAEIRGTLAEKGLTQLQSVSATEQRHDPASLIHSAHLKHTYFNEAFRVLRTNLEFSSVDRELKSFSILSANAWEGKTLLNANLALALAATGKKVLLVDADLRKPRVHSLFKVGVRKDQGLPLLLSGQSKNLDKYLFRGPVPGLWLLPCGVLVPNPSELLGSVALSMALTAMKKRFDHVVFDASPILPVTDGVVLSTRLDGVAVMARFEQTRRVELKRALEYLAAVKAPVLGTILNAVDMRKYSYAYGYGSRYYSYHDKRNKFLEP